MIGIPVYSEFFSAESVLASPVCQSWVSLVWFDRCSCHLTALERDERLLAEDLFRRQQGRHGLSPRRLGDGPALLPRRRRVGVHRGVR